MEIPPLFLYFLMEYNEAPRMPRRSLRAAAPWATALTDVSIGRTAVGTSRNPSPINTAVYLTNLA